jgi:hypothetical protein
MSLSVLVCSTFKYGCLEKHEKVQFVCFVHRHLSNIDCLMAHTACLVCFISTVNGPSKKGGNALEDVALVVGTQ